MCRLHFWPPRNMPKILPWSLMLQKSTHLLVAIVGCNGLSGDEGRCHSPDSTPGFPTHSENCVHPEPTELGMESLLAYNSQQCLDHGCPKFVSIN